MKALVCKHLSFVPATQFGEWNGNPKSILVFTSRINGRNYKVKREIVGEVAPYTDRKKGEQWRFRSFNVGFKADSVLIIAKFLNDMNVGRIELDTEKGELEHL